VKRLQQLADFREGSGYKTLIPKILLRDVEDGELSWQPGSKINREPKRMCSKLLRKVPRFSTIEVVGMGSLRIRRSFGQHDIERAVVAIDVVEKINLAIFLHDRREIDNHHRY
jgi:hypothetical protein